MANIVTKETTVYPTKDWKFRFALGEAQSKKFEDEQKERQALFEKFLEMESKLAYDKRNNSEVYKTYDAFMKRMQDSVDMFRSTGRTFEKDKLYNLRADAIRELGPIAEAIKRRDLDIKRQQSRQDISGGRMKFSRDAETTLIDEYMYGSPGYTQINLDKVEQRAMKAGLQYGKNLLTKMQTMPEAMTMYNNLVNQGKTNEEIIKVMYESDKFPELNKEIDKIINQYKSENIG